MIYTLTVWLCLATEICIPVEIEGTVLYAWSSNQACLALAMLFVLILVIAFPPIATYLV